MVGRTASSRYDVVIALLLAALLTIAWSVRDASALAALRLPDTDDVMRLQQIRDWIAGQGFADLHQHRLADGVAMHWSRLPDLVPAAIIVILRPVLGVHGAEVAAVILWPAMLFGAALALVGAIARRLAPDAARVAIVLAGVAYPVTTLFAPGRIDHHGFQVVLVLLLARALLACGARAGLVAGLAIAASLVIGIEMAPLLLAGAAIIWMRWALGLARGAMLRGLGTGLSLGLGAGALVFAPDLWSAPACDSFTRALWLAGQVAALMPLVLGFASPMVATRSLRVAVTLGPGGIALLPALALAPACARPYAAVDPLVARLWLSHVAEAQPLFQAPLALALAYAGLLVAGLVAGGLLARRGAGWRVLFALQLVSAAITLTQLRGVYAGVMLGVPALAVMIGMARARGLVPLAGAWAASAGMLYPMAAQAFAPAGGGLVPASNRCDVAEALEHIPPGTVMAPIDAGAYALARTRDRMIAAPYHRNNAGNAAMYRFFLGSPGAAQVIAARWQVDYVALCPGDFGELPRVLTTDPRRMIARLNGSGAPAWLRPLASRAGARLWRVEPRLPKGGALP